MELLIAFLSKTLNMDADSLAEMLYKKADDGTLTDQPNEQALEALLAKDAERVQALKGKSDGKEQFDNGYKKGQKEALENLEKAVRSEFKADDVEKQGIDLVKHVVAKAAKTKLGDDEVKVHPLYLKLEADAQKIADNVASEWESKLKDLETAYNRDKTFSSVSSKIQEVFEGLKPVLPQNPTAAATIRQEFVQRFTGYDYELTENGQVVVMKDGKRVEDAHGHAVSLESLVTQEASKRFDFMKQDDKGNAGNTETAPGGKMTFKDIGEYEDKFYSAKTADERAAVQNAWEAQNSAT